MNRNLVTNLRYRLPKDSPAHKLATALEEGYLAQKREEKVVHKTSFAPSSIAYGSGTCPRRWVMSFMDEFVGTENTDAMGMAVLKNGVTAHDRIQEALEHSGVLVENEREIWYDDPPIHAFVDSIVKLDDLEYIVEIKTVPQEKYYMRESAMKGLDYHYYQLLFYMYILEIPRGFLLYENRNDLSMVTIPVELDDRNTKVVEDAFAWMRMVYKTWQDGDMPKRPFTKSSFACKFCPLKDACWSTEDGNVTVPTMEVNDRW